MAENKMDEGLEGTTATRPVGRKATLGMMAAVGVVVLLFGGIYAALGFPGLPTDDGADPTETAKEGDTLAFTYWIHAPDGSLWETNEVHDIPSIRDRYMTEGPPSPPTDEAHGHITDRNAVVDAHFATAVLGSNMLHLPTSVDDGFLGMAPGEERSMPIAADQMLGTWEPLGPDGQGIPRLMFGQPFQETVFLQEADAARLEGRSGTPEFDLDTLQDGLGPLASGSVYNPGRAFPPSWDIVFEDVNPENRSIFIRHMVQHGDVFSDTGLPGEVVAVVTGEGADRTLAWRLDLVEGATFIVEVDDDLFKAGFPAGSYRVDTVAAETIHMTFLETPHPHWLDETFTLTVALHGIGTESAEPGYEEFPEAHDHDHAHDH